MTLSAVFYRGSIAVASAISGGVAYYLHREKMRPPEPVDAFSPCLVEGGCATVQNSAYGWFLGYDVALIGAVGYAAILAVSLFGLRRDWRGREEPTVVLMGLIYPAVLFTAWLKYAEFIVLRSFCPWCAVSTVTIVLCAILVTLDWRRVKREDDLSYGGADG
jgi:uncharacterized membrane protein